MPPHHGTSFFLSLFPWNLISMHSYCCITSYHSAAKALERAFSEKSRLFFFAMGFLAFLGVSRSPLSLSLSPVEKSLSSPQFRELTHLGFFGSLGDERVYHYWPVTTRPRRKRLRSLGGNSFSLRPFFTSKFQNAVHGKKRRGGGREELK